MIFTVGNTAPDALASHVREIQDTLRQSSNRRQNAADIRSIGLPASVATVAGDTAATRTPRELISDIVLAAGKVY